MGFAEALSDNGSLTGRSHPSRDDYRQHVAELGAISYIRRRRSS
jgi:hypothetical protein